MGSARVSSRQPIASGQLISSEQPAGRDAPARKVRPTLDGAAAGNRFGSGGGGCCARCFCCSAAAASLNVQPTRFVPDVEFKDKEWGEAIASERDYTEYYSYRNQILFKMKLKGPNAGAALTVLSRSSSIGAKVWRDQQIWQNNQAKGDSERTKNKRLGLPKRIDKRPAYGYSYYNAFYRRWTHAWFVDYQMATSADVYIERPTDAQKFDDRPHEGAGFH